MNTHSIMPKTLEQNQIIKEASRKRIMDAALAMFGEYGYDRATVGAIAKKAGVSAGLLYNYFESKEELVITIFEDFLKHHFSVWYPKVCNARSPMDKLEAAVDRYVQPLQEDVNRWRLIRELSTRKEFKHTIWEFLSPIRKKYQDELEQVYHPLGLDAETEFWNLQTFLEGVSSCYCTYGDRYPLATVKRTYLERFEKLHQHHLHPDR